LIKYFKNRTTYKMENSRNIFKNSNNPERKINIDNQFLELDLSLNKIPENNLIKDQTLNM
jgi:hypothetical protein